MRRFLTFLPWILLVIVIITFTAWNHIKAPIAADGVKLPPEKTQALIDDGTLQNTGIGVASYSKAVKVAAPAVVNIFTMQKNIPSDQLSINEKLLQELFGDQLPPNTTPQQSNLGSGVIVREDGYILTNHHVIAQADQIIVGLYDGRKAAAKVIGVDPETDLAVIKIELDNLPVLPFKLSGNEVGDVVLAIGNPFGVGQTVTQGIISATDRAGLGINTYENFIQTDAAINPGNSGGALIDVAGNLIGVNTAIFSKTGGSLGIGFAIPAETCKQVLDSILAHGHVIRGWLGIEVIGLSQNNELTTIPQLGVKVVNVLPNGPAERAGIQKDDIIFAINDQSMKSANQLISYIARQSPNSDIQIQIKRGDEKIRITATIGQRPESKTNTYIRIPQQLQE